MVFKTIFRVNWLFKIAINVNAEPMYVPIIKTAEELANEEIKSIRE